VRGDQWFLHSRSGDLELSELPRYPDAGRDELTGGLKAPMPGVIRSVFVTPGEHVAKGHVLLILEAMKMQNEVRSPGPGTVAAVRVAVGDTVASGQVLVTLE
jgi:biotin carboxyl carrier protein